MIKTMAELLEDLRANRTRATLENVISDLEQSGVRELEDHARIVKGALQRNPGEEGARIYIPITEGMLERHRPIPLGGLPGRPLPGGFPPIGGRRRTKRSTRRRRTTRRR